MAQFNAMLTMRSAYSPETQYAMASPWDWERNSLRSWRNSTSSVLFLMFE